MLMDTPEDMLEESKDSKSGFGLPRRQCETPTPPPAPTRTHRKWPSSSETAN